MVGSDTDVVLVDRNDKFVGLREKYLTHKVPVPLHRAVSIVILDPSGKKMLLTKRAAKKKTWPNFWSNAVCSHPYPNESYAKAAGRRLYEELGFKVSLKKSFDFVYSAEMDNKTWGEHEYDVVFLGSYWGLVKPNPEEIDDYEWISIKKVKEEVSLATRKYTPWFEIILKKLGI